MRASVNVDANSLASTVSSFIDKEGINNVRPTFDDKSRSRGGPSRGYFFVLHVHLSSTFKVAVLTESVRTLVQSWAGRAT